MFLGVIIAIVQSILPRMSSSEADSVIGGRHRSCEDTPMLSNDWTSLPRRGDAVVLLGDTEISEDGVVTCCLSAAVPMRSNGREICTYP